MASKKKRKNKKYAGTELEAGYVPGNDANLFLDRPFMALSNLSKKKNGKEVPVNIQISDYLKSMKLLESSTSSLEKLVEKNNKLLSKLAILESKKVKGKIRGKKYTTTLRMIEAVKKFDNGKITRETLVKEASWALDPDLAIEIARIIGGQIEA